ncbi:MAG TPA: hypothetical protein VJV79_27555 [Polyangiaceae bacterium]|nr:hypothetical protein [Polyangiaceae bacterium]
MSEETVDRSLLARGHWSVRDVSPVSISAILTLAVFVVIFLALRPAHGIDDADITMVYARNVAAGHGYVYTPGGERVEGSTSLAWTLVCALVFASGSSSMIPLFAIVILFTFTACFAGLELARRAGGTTIAILSSALLMAASPSYFAWTLGTLMDTALWSACIVVALLQSLSITARAWPWRLSLAIVALLLARPEGVAIAGAILLVAFISHASSGIGIRASWRAILPPLVVTVACFTALLACRVAYFGYPMPNTYYAKVGADAIYTATHGGVYLVKFLLRNPVNLLAAFAAVHVLATDGRAALARMSHPNRAKDGEEGITRLSLSIVFACGLALPFVEGEDHFVGSRMMQPFVPVSCALVGSLAAKWLVAEKSRHRRIVSVALLGSAAFAVWVDFVLTTAPELKRQARIASTGRIMGRLLAERLGQAMPMPTVGVACAGGIAFAYPGRVMDLLGLNWVAMAHGTRDRRGRPGHAAFAKDVFWSESSTLVLPQIFQSPPRNACDLSSKWLHSVFRGLFSSSRFRREYTGISMSTPEGNLATFVRRDWLATHPMPEVQSLDWPVGMGERCGSEHLPRRDD